MPTTLYPHNAEAVRHVQAAFRDGDRAAVVHATGTGKSYIIEAVASAYRRVAVIAPNRYVLQEVQKRDIRADFLTYPTVMAMKTFPQDRYDLIVLDEFHRAGAECWGAGVGALLLTNPKAKVLGTTATDIRYLDGERNMADEIFDGNVVSRLTLTDAWLQGILPVPKYVVGLYNYEDVYRDLAERLMRNRVISEQDRREAREALQRGRLKWETSHGVTQILRRHLPQDIRRMVVFCDRAEGIERVQDEFTGWMAKAGFRSVVYTVHYRNADSAIDMEDFQKDEEGEPSTVKVLFAINMLNEGVHVPGVEAIVMLRPTTSKIIMLQQMGRCMNVGQKTQPVILDLVDNLTNSSEVLRLRDEYASRSGETLAVNDEGARVTEFTVTDYVKDIRDIIFSVNAFRPQYRYEENLAHLRHYVKEERRWPKVNAGDYVERSAATFAYVNRGDEPVRELRSWAEANIGLKPWRRVPGFDQYLEDVTAFIKTNRRWPAPNRIDKQENNMYLWLRRHLENRKTGRLDAFREYVKEEFGCDIHFPEGHKRVDVENLVRQLSDFLEQNGRWPSFSSEDREETLLYNRCQSHRNNPAIVELKERAKIEYGASFRESRRSFDDYLPDLQRFVRENRCWPRNGGDAEEKSLRLFLYSYKDDPRLTGLLEEARENYSLEFPFKTIVKEDFDTLYEQLEAFVAQRHKWPTVGKFGKNPDMHERKLTNFYKRNADNPKVSALLDRTQKEYGFLYNPRYDDTEMRAKVLAFLKENGRWPRQAAEDYDERRMSRWICHCKKKLPDTYGELISEASAAGVASRKSLTFEEHLDRLKAFVEENRRWPKQDVADRDEHNIALFASRHKTDVRIAELLTQANDAYDLLRRKPFAERLSELESFVEKERRMPSIAANDETELSLARWAKSKDHAKDERVKAAKARAEELQGEDEERHFKSKLTELEAYITKNGKWPSHHSDDPEEYTWGYFLRKHRTEPSIVEMKKHFRKKTDVLVTAPYAVRLQELSEFVRQHARLPQWNATDKYEKDLYYFYVSKKKRPRYADDIKKAVSQYKNHGQE